MNQKEKEIDELLASIKQKTGLTQEQIAGRIGYNRSYISQAKKTDSEKLYKALEKEFRQELENITIQEQAPAYDARTSLERTLENLSEDKLKSTAIIERLVSLLEKQLGENTGPFLVPPGTPGTIPINKKQEKTSR